MLYKTKDKGTLKDYNFFHYFNYHSNNKNNYIYSSKTASTKNNWKN